MSVSKGTKSAIGMGLICLLHLLVMLVFRAFFYLGMYKAPEDAYGISDIIVLFLAAVFILLLALSVFWALVLWLRGGKQTKGAALGLILFSALLFISQPSLHQLAARWAS